LDIDQSFRVPYTLDQVWRRFHDVEGIVTCLPGASLTAPPTNGNLALSMTVKLGPILAAFSGEGEMLLDEASYRGSLVGGGSDRKSGSRLKGEARFSLHDESAQSPSTRIDVHIAYSIAGALAQFSRESIVRDLTERLTAAFRDNLQAKLSAEGGASASAAPVTPAPSAAPTLRTAAEPQVAAIAAAVPDAAAAPPAASTPAAPLDLGRLLWPMLRQRFKSWFTNWGKRSGDVPSRHD
jgi:carbon monoxide dehydrogenase subunit G